MKRLTKAIAIILMLLLSLTSLSACHPKNEVAYKIGEVEFTSGMYSCVLFWCTNEAQSVVYEKLTDEQKEEEINWAKQEIDGVKFDDYVKAETIETLSRFAATETECKKLGVELDKETKEYAQSYANYYWTSYGYGAVMEPNGVGFDTYCKYMEYEYLYDELFVHLYGEEGEKALSEEDLNKELTKNYGLYNILTISLVDSNKKALADDKIAELKADAEDYAKRINDGETFADIYAEYNKEDEKEEDKKEDAEDKKEESTDKKEETEDKKEEEKEPYSEPVDKNAKFISGLEDSSYYNEEIWKQLSEMETGKAKTYVSSDNSAVNVLVKLDVLEDPYWSKNYRDTVTYALKGEEFDAYLKATSDALSKDENTFATNQFKASKINYGE